MPVTSILITKRLGNGEGTCVQVDQTRHGRMRSNSLAEMSTTSCMNLTGPPPKTRERARRERDVQNAQPIPSPPLPNSPTFGAFTTPARNGDSIDPISSARGGRTGRRPEFGVSFGEGDFITDAFGAAAHKKPTTVMALNRWMEGRMSAPLTRTTTCQVFRRRLGGTRDFGPVLLPRPAPRGRMLLFRSAPEITNGRTGCCGTKVDATLFGTGSRHRREGGERRLRR